MYTQFDGDGPHCHRQILDGTAILNFHDLLILLQAQQVLNKGPSGNTFLLFHAIACLSLEMHCSVSKKMSLGWGSEPDSAKTAFCGTKLDLQRPLVIFCFLIFCRGFGQYSDTVSLFLMIYSVTVRYKNYCKG